MVNGPAPGDVILSRFQVREVLALYVPIAETRSIIGVVCLTVQIDISVILKDLDHLIPNIHVACTAAINADDRFGMEFVRIPKRSFSCQNQLSLSILRRASVRGKELPEVLKKALERQAGGLTLEVEPIA